MAITSISIEITLFRIILIERRTKGIMKKTFMDYCSLCNAIHFLYGLNRQEDIMDADQFQELFSILMQRGLKIIKQ
jgi:hypothetical protein